MEGMKKKIKTGKNAEKIVIKKEQNIILGVRNDQKQKWRKEEDMREKEE